MCAKEELAIRIPELLLSHNGTACVHINTVTRVKIDHCYTKNIITHVWTKLHVGYANIYVCQSHMPTTPLFTFALGCMLIGYQQKQKRLTFRKGHPSLVGKGHV